MFFGIAFLPVETKKYSTSEVVLNSNFVYMKIRWKRTLAYHSYVVLSRYLLSYSYIQKSYLERKSNQI